MRGEPLATLVLLVHALYAALAVVTPFALALGLATQAPGAHWLVGWPARAFHLASTTFAALQAALGWPCPLTEWELALRGLPPGAAFLPASLEGLPGPASRAAVVLGVALHLCVGLAAQALLLRRSPARPQRLHP